MNIDLQALEQALAPLAEIGQDEIEFPAGNTTVHLRVLIPSEERAVQRYAAGAITRGDEEDTQSAQEFLDRFRIEVLAYAIVQVGDTDLRDVKVVPTGKKLDNEKPITVPKAQAMRDLINKWTRPVIDSVFRKYGEALDKVEQRAAKAIHFEPADLDIEIERLEARVIGLKEERERRKNPSKSSFSTNMELATGASHEDKRDREEGLDSLRAARGQERLESEMEVERLEAEASGQAPPPPEEDMNPEVFGGPRYTPQEAQAPVRTPRVPPVPAAGGPPARIDQPQTSEPPQRNQGPLDDVRDSFMDSGDSDNMRSAMAAEERRILERRQRQAAGLPSQSPSVLGQLRTGQRPPHQDAAQVEAVEQTLAQGADLARAEQVGSVGQMPAYRLPPQGVAPRGDATPKAAPPAAAPPDGGSRNPRFNPKRA